MSIGYRALAASVVIRAIKDSNGSIEPGVPKHKRRELYESARAFLKPDNPEFVLYCDTLDLDPVALCEAIKLRGRNFTVLARQSKALA